MKTILAPATPCVWEADETSGTFWGEPWTEKSYWCVTHDSAHLDGAPAEDEVQEPISKCCGESIVYGLCNGCGGHA